MKTQNKKAQTKKSLPKNQCNCSSQPSSGAVYGLGFIGAAIYYISTATTFWMGALGFLKALIWPLFLVYDLLKYIG